MADSARLANVASITAEGQDITLTLAEPDSSLLWNLTGRAGLILKEGDTVDYQTAANGTGPFVLTAGVQGDSITFARNDDYWGEQAQVAEVVFDYIPDNQAAAERGTRRRGRRAHRVRREPEGADRGDRRLHARARRVHRQGHARVQPDARRPLADQRVRQAIRQAIDHDAIVEALASGQTQYGPIPVLDPGYEDLSDVAPFDPEAAKALLAEAGVEDLTLTLTIPSFYSTTIPQILVSDLNDVGITLEVDSVDFPTWLNDVYSTRTTTCQLRAAHRGARLRELGEPGLLLHLRQPRGAGPLRASRSRRPTRPKLPTCSQQAARIVSEDAAADWLYNGASVVAVGTDIGGVPVDQRERAPQPRRADQERRVIRYTLTRLALLLLGLLVASVLIFLTLRVLPGDVAQLIAGINSTPEQVEAIRERLGLNQPLPRQYLEWIGGVFRGDLGSRS